MFWDGLSSWLFGWSGVLVTAFMAPLLHLVLLVFFHGVVVAFVGARGADVGSVLTG